jgi:hypothetical protein
MLRAAADADRLAGKLYAGHGADAGTPERIAAL